MNVTVDTRAFAAACDDIAKRQLPYAVSLAMNRTGEEARNRMRNQLHLSFTIRTGQSAKFLEQQIQVTERSRKDNLALTVAARGPGAKMLARHEKGGVRVAAPFFIPTEELRPSRQSVIPRSKYPKALRLDTRRGIVGSLPALRKGKRRTFIIQSDRTPRASGIYERFGPRKDEIRALWLFRPRVTLKPRLQFVKTVTDFWSDHFLDNLAGFLGVALKTAR